MQYNFRVSGILSTQKPVNVRVEPSPLSAMRLDCYQPISWAGNIMGNTMTVTALCKLFMDGGTVRLAMAILACRQLAVRRMTLGAGQGRMFCLVVLQQLVCFFMTSGADLFVLGHGIRDF